MFTGIVKGVATVTDIADRSGLRRFTLQCPPSFCQHLAIGGSVACDGVCLTVTTLKENDSAVFDVMQESLRLTTLAHIVVGDRVNVERAAIDGAEIGGHPISGHVDCTATVVSVDQPANNHVIRASVPVPTMRYIFGKGYIAVNGASLTVATADRAEGWFEVWLIPETLRSTTLGEKRRGDLLNIEIERGTQVFVDTVRDVLQERLGPLLPAIEAVLKERGMSADAFAQPIAILKP